jgi:hypothetical protein
MSNYLVLVLDRYNVLQTKISPSGKESDMSQLFPKHQEAERWGIRRLVQDCEPGSFCLIQSTRFIGRDGSPLTLKITREEAMSKHFPKAKSPATKVLTGKSAPLSFPWKMRESRSTFSHG